MSSFICRAKNPETGEFEDAEWLDNYFGRHRYGVRFPSSGRVYPDRDTWEFEEVMPAKEREDGDAV